MYMVQHILDRIASERVMGEGSIILPVGPVQPIPPHWPQCAAVAPVGVGAVVDVFTVLVGTGVVGMIVVDDDVEAVEAGAPPGIRLLRPNQLRVSVSCSGTVCPTPCASMA